MRREYLDGLRGWASLFVVFAHLGPVFLLATKTFPPLPFFMDGVLAVYVFFVLSGYVLSIGFFERRDPRILTALAIRRYVRLTIPILASCSIALLMVSAGLMPNVLAGELAQSPWLKSFYAFPASLASMLRFSLLDVYIDPKAPSYNAVLWTMLYEFWGSVALLSALWCLRTTTLRMAGYAAASLACLYFSSPLLTFVIGVALANGSPAIHAWASSRPRIAGAAGWSLMVVAGLCAMFRSGVLSSPISISLIAGAILAAVLLSPAMQRSLSTPLSQLLGRLSFPMYLTHLLVICSWSSWLYIELQDANAAIRATAIVLSTVVLSLAAAAAFSPLEIAAIRLARDFSRLLQPERRRIASN